MNQQQAEQNLIKRMSEKKKRELLDYIIDSM